MADIELVIKIDKETYHASKQRVANTKMIINEIDVAIANSIPLPKGHGRLIDADAVLVKPYGDTVKDIELAETIIEADKEGKEPNVLIEKQDVLDEIIRFGTEEGSSIDCSQLYYNIKNMPNVLHNKTNGEVIQALFPNIDKSFSNVIDLNLWWNTTYKEEEE